jgi:hypothetical protein
VCVRGDEDDEAGKEGRLGGKRGSGERGTRQHRASVITKLFARGGAYVN